MKITTATGKSSFLLIPGRAEPASRRVASAKKGYTICRPVRRGRAPACSPSRKAPHWGCGEEHTLWTRLARLKLWLFHGLALGQ